MRVKAGQTTAMLRLPHCSSPAKIFVSADDTLEASQIHLTQHWIAAQSKGNNSLLTAEEVERVPDWLPVVTRHASQALARASGAHAKSFDGTPFKDKARSISCTLLCCVEQRKGHSACVHRSVLGHTLAQTVSKKT